MDCFISQEFIDSLYESINTERQRLIKFSQKISAKTEPVVYGRKLFSYVPAHVCIFSIQTDSKSKNSTKKSWIPSHANCKKHRDPYLRFHSNRFLRRQIFNFWFRSESVLKCDEFVSLFRCKGSPAINSP